jgi:hypothetical protein
VKEKRKIKNKNLSLIYSMYANPLMPQPEEGKSLKNQHSSISENQVFV